MRMGKLVPVAIGATLLGGCHKEQPAPSIDGLKSALERSADKALDASSIAGDQVALTATSATVDEVAARVIKAASDAGGAGIRSTTPDGQSSVLATIPRNNADAFKAALRHETLPMQKPSPGTTLIEITISTPAAASPVP
jgi:hypothetical protein